MLKSEFIVTCADLIRDQKTTVDSLCWLCSNSSVFVSKFSIGHSIVVTSNTIK